MLPNILRPHSEITRSVTENPKETKEIQSGCKRKIRRWKPRNKYIVVRGYGRLEKMKESKRFRRMKQVVTTSDKYKESGK